MAGGQQDPVCTCAQLGSQAGTGIFAKLKSPFCGAEVQEDRQLSQGHIVLSVCFLSCQR